MQADCCTAKRFWLDQYNIHSISGNDSAPLKALLQDLMLIGVDAAMLKLEQMK